MNDTNRSERIRAAVCHRADHAAKGVFNPPPPRETISQIAAEANGVTLPTERDGPGVWENKVFLSTVKPGSLTDRAIKANATKTKKPVRTQ